MVLSITVLFLRNVQVAYRRTQDFTMEEFMWWGAGPEGLGDVSLPVESRGKVPVGSLGDKVPQKLKLVYIL